MDIIPIKPDKNLESLLGSLSRFPFSFVKVNNPGNHENENIVLKAEEDIQSLYEYMLVYAVEDMTTPRLQQVPSPDIRRPGTGERQLPPGIHPSRLRHHSHQLRHNRPIQDNILGPSRTHLAHSPQLHRNNKTRRLLLRRI